MSGRAERIAKVLIDHGDALDPMMQASLLRELEKEKAAPRATAPKPQRQEDAPEPPVYKLEDLPMDDQAPPAPVESKQPVQVEVAEPWQKWTEQLYWHAKSRIPEFEASGQTERAARTADYVRKWEQARGRIGAEGIAGVPIEPPKKPVVMPSVAHVPGESPLDTRIRQTRQAQELERQGIVVPIENPELQNLSKLDDPRYFRPPEYNNRANDSYGILDMLPLSFGGKVEAWHEPTLEEFKEAKRGDVGAQIDAMDRDSSEYRKYADEEWVRAYEEAKADGRPIFRHSVKMGTLTGEGWGKLTSPLKVFGAIKDPATRGSTISALAEETLDQVTGGISAFDDAFGGPLKGALGAAGDVEAADAARASQERTTVGPAAGAAAGILSPRNPAALVSGGTYNVAKRALPGAVGRTVAATGAGATGAAAQEAFANQMRGLSGDPGTRTDVGTAALVGGALAGPLHAAGEGIASRVAARRAPGAPEGELMRAADKAGVKPSLFGSAKVPSDVEALHVEAAARNVPPAVLQTEKMMEGGVQRAAIRAELANLNTEAQRDLSAYFNEPQGRQQVSIQPVVDKARSLLGELTYAGGKVREGVNVRDVAALGDIIESMKAGGPTRDARGVSEAIDRMRRNFNMTPGSETNLTPEGEKIAKELTQEFLNIRDQFAPHPEYAPASLQYVIPIDEKNERVVSGLSAAMHRRSEEKAAHAARKENAGLPKGELHPKPYRRDVEGFQKLEANLDNRQLGNVRRVWAAYKSGGVDAIPRDTAIQEIAKYDPQLDRQLRTLVANAAAENLDRFLRGGQTAIITGTPTSPGGWFRLRPSNIGIRTDPSQRKLAAEAEVPVTESIIKLLKSLRGQKAEEVGPLAGPLALRGGAAGARTEQLLTHEDIGNLKALLGLYRTNGEDR